MNIDKIKSLFPIFKINKEIVYLDSAASSLKPQRVIDALTYYYANNGSNIHRGVYKLASIATDAFELTRKNLATFINALENEVIFTKGTTDSLNIIAESYKNFINEGDEIITSELEHHSSMLPWQQVAIERKAKLVYVPLDSDHKITVENFKKVLTDKTKVVALTHVSNVLGYETPIKEIAFLAHQKNAIVILDAAQSISHMPIDVKDLNVDFMAFSSHKMYGPNGVGVLYGKYELLEKMPPVEFGGEMVHLTNKENATWKVPPYKFEAGTPDVADVIALNEAVSLINEIGFKTIMEHEEKLHQYTLEKMSKIKGVNIFNQKADHAIIAFNINDVHPHDVASILDQYNVCVRAGHHCAQLVSKALNQPSTLRASFAIYNTYEDCDKLVDAVIKARDFFNQF
ncbi:Cysteine desulfurase [Alteracholeplasma palmae J233]|uniref:Cysteine desulfurase n=1 Tax=Alteracholeplasma palmae (strain ATCC 49389 / J233) TaxID=1318466 RepID=U4KJS3_ALTPJ|nr:cysteine desulfurase [Alteracholeplasma palmae]CCV63804.1 Cysteine desulfurase [Alteracholeplasma palmae J233]